MHPYKAILRLSFPYLCGTCQWCGRGSCHPLQFPFILACWIFFSKCKSWNWNIWKSGGGQKLKCWIVSTHNLLCWKIAKCNFLRFLPLFPDIFNLVCLCCCLQLLSKAVLSFVTCCQCKLVAQLSGLQKLFLNPIFERLGPADFMEF